MKKKSIPELIAEYNERIDEIEDCIVKTKEKLKRLQYSGSTREIYELERKLCMYYDVLDEQCKARNDLKKYMGEII